MIKIEPLDNFLDIIKSRVLKALPQTIVYRTSMIVTTPIENNSKAKVMIPGDSAEYALINKTGDFLYSGDSVIVESTGTNLNNGLIVHKFGSNTSFTDAVYENSWETYSGSHNNAGYRVSGKTVYFRGLVKSGTVPSVIFTLPIEIRPTKQLLISTISENAFACFEVNNDGSVKARVGSNGYFSLEGCFFELD